MASLQLLKPTFTSISTSHPGKSSWVFRESDSRKRVLRFASSISRNSGYYYTNRSFRVCCEGRDTDDQSNNGKLLYTYSSSFSCFLRFLWYGYFLFLFFFFLLERKVLSLCLAMKKLKKKNIKGNWVCVSKLMFSVMLVKLIWKS